MSWIDGVRARFMLLLRREAAESRMNEEIRFHIEQEANRIAREEGVDGAEARRRAMAAFGGVEKHKEALRADRGGSWLAGLSLDFTLGVRVFLKYPGLTIVGVVGMSIGVAIGATGFAAIDAVVGTRLPFEGGDRVIALQNLGFRGRDGRQANLHDLEEWRANLRGVELFGAYRTLDRNLITANGAVTPFRVAEMSANAFTIAGAAPILGRHLLADDERRDAPPVVVIGYTVWQRTFFSDSAIVGTSIKLGDAEHTIVGVMPRGFAFPINNSIWTPLRLSVADYEPGRAPAIDVFARMTVGTTIENVHAQVEAIEKRLAAANPRARENIASRAALYAHSFVEIPINHPTVQLLINSARVLMSLILVIVGANVAILVYARTASRTGEIAVRTALGASRVRIVGQFFAEALVLSCAASAVAVAGSVMVLRYLVALVDRWGGEQVPFWMTPRLSTATILYIAGLTVLAAVIIGVIPALKATQRRITVTLQQLGAGGSGLRLGKVWNTLIVAQVAATVALMPVAVYAVGSWLMLRAPVQSIPINELLMANLYLDRAGAGTDDFAEYRGDEFRARFASMQSELVRALESDPRVASVTFSSARPGAEQQERFEVDTLQRDARSDSAQLINDRGRWMLTAAVEPGQFEAFGIKPLAGRVFDAGDVADEPRVAVVNRSFVNLMLGNGPALGRRMRSFGRSGDRDSGRWLEIIGVVPDMPFVQTATESMRSKIYVPMRAQDAFPATLAIRVRAGTPGEFVPHLTAITTRVSPMLRLGRVEPLATTLDADNELPRAVTLAVAVVAISVLLLSGAGIYALMSFTVTRRRREIGIRSALGAGTAQVVRGVLARALLQIGAGIAIGLAFTKPVDAALGAHMFRGWGILVLPIVVLIMFAIGLASAAGPVRRALQIQPTEALRGE
jgi:putative ABC transport system permease protein